jgi:16S rRNA (uracil1498-N3)-methyltransferase
VEYCYTPKQYISGSSLSIVDEESRHLIRVLRKKAGEKIHVTDGLGNVYECEIEKTSRDITECIIISSQSNLNEPVLNVKLYPSILKNPDRFEFVIEKSVELGVKEIQPVITEFVVNKFTNKTERWNKIAVSAMKQSQRCYLPLINEPVKYSEAVVAAGGIKLIAHEKYGNRLCEVMSDNKNIISLFIGPEGGFSENEIKMASDNSFTIVKLSERKFRSETAALVLLSKILL